MNKFSFVINIFICFILILIIQCDKWDFKIKIVNICKSNIYYFFYNFAYPYATLRNEYNPANSLETHSVKSGDTELNPVRGSWEGGFDIHGTIVIFIFDETKLKAVPCNTIRKGITKYELKLENFGFSNLLIINNEILC